MSEPATNDPKPGIQGQAFLKQLAGQLMHNLTANDAIRKYTNNPDVIGAFAEATVRQFVARVVAPLGVTRGAIVYEDIIPDGVREIDCIIWIPCPVPPVFEVGDFALVPRGSALAFLEIKRSPKWEAPKKMREQLDRGDKLLELPGVQWPHPRCLGVVCMADEGSIAADMKALVNEKKAVILLTKKHDDSVEPNPGAVYDLLNFLLSIRAYARFVDGCVYSRYTEPEPARDLGEAMA